MPSSLFLVATRAFVKVLLALARTYELALQVNKESSAEQLVKAYKKVLLRPYLTEICFLQGRGSRKLH